MSLIRRSLWADVILSQENNTLLATRLGVSASHISQMRKVIRTMKYRPRVEGGKVVCLNCGNGDSLVLHHDHNTNQVICLLCKGCNSKLGNQVIFDGLLNDFDSIDGDAVKYSEASKLAVKSIGFKVVSTFPLSGTDVKCIIENLGNILSLQKKPDFYETWLNLPSNNGLKEAINKLIKWLGYEGKM